MTFKITVYTEDNEAANALIRFLEYTSYDADMEDIEDDEGEALTESEA